jgi:hypothetical protein
MAVKCHIAAKIRKKGNVMKRFIVGMFCVAGLLWLCGCEGSGGSGAGLESGAGASLSFRVEWVDDPRPEDLAENEDSGAAMDGDVAPGADPDDDANANVGVSFGRDPEPLMLAGAVKLSDDCSARGVANVRVSVRDSSGASLKSATFACSARQGTLTGVTPGSNRTIRVSGLNSDGTETWRGEKTGVTLVAGANNIGTIQVAEFKYTITVSGRVTREDTGEGVDGVTIIFSSRVKVGDAKTSGGGYYSKTLPGGWYGKISASYKGELLPSFHSYSTHTSSGSNYDFHFTPQDNQSPTAAITSPADNSTHTYGDIVSFVGTGTDPEDGDVLGSRFVWTSSRDGEIRSGRKSFSISSLSVGTHTITLTVTDSDEVAGNKSITITINAINQPPSAKIESPASNSALNYNQVFMFVGSGTDPEDGDLPASAFKWESDQDGHIISGMKNFSIENLSLGRHILTLTVIDSNGDSGTATCNIVIYDGRPLRSLHAYCYYCAHDDYIIDRGCEDDRDPCYPFDYEDLGICAGTLFPPTYFQPSKEYYYQKGFVGACDCFDLKNGDNVYIEMEIVVDPGSGVPVEGDMGVYWAEDVNPGIPAQVFPTVQDGCENTQCIPSSRFNGQYSYMCANGNSGTPYAGSACTLSDSNRVVKIVPVLNNNNGLKIPWDHDHGCHNIWVDIPKMRVDPNRVEAGWKVFVMICIDDNRFYTRGSFNYGCCGLIFIGDLCPTIYSD